MDDETSHHLEEVLSQLKNLEYDLEQLNDARKSKLESDDTDSSDEDDEKPLSHAEESAIEECLNDTEGSLSNVSLAETSWSGATEPMNVDRVNIQTSMDQTINDTANLSLRGDVTKSCKSPQQTKNPFNLLNNTRRVVRRKRRNSPPVRKNDKAHVHSFFSAMADLVSTFPDGHVEMAKRLVNSILQEMVEELKKQLNDTEPNSTPQDYAIVPTDLRLIIQVI